MENNEKTFKRLLSLGDTLINMSDDRGFLHSTYPSFDGNETRDERVYDKHILHIISHAVKTIKHVPVMKNYGKWDLLIYNMRQEDINDMSILLGMLMNDDQRYVELSDIVAKKYYQTRIKFLNLKDKSKTKHNK